jgi:hypothetical protein
MPLARYFFFVGGVLLALLFFSDAYLPQLPVTRANPDLPVIRIHSDRKWPEHVVYNTNLPTIIPAHIANTDSLPAPATVADTSVKAQEAFAQLQPSDANQQQPSKKSGNRRCNANARLRRDPRRRPQSGWRSDPNLVSLGEASGE